MGIGAEAITTSVILLCSWVVIQGVIEVAGVLLRRSGTRDGTID